MCITECLQSLKCDQNICLSLFYDRLCDLVAITDKCYNTSASLCHTVYFRKFDVIATCDRQTSEDSAREKGSLSTDTDDHNIFYCHLIRPPSQVLSH